MDEPRNQMFFFCNLVEWIRANIEFNDSNLTKQIIVSIKSYQLSHPNEYKAGVFFNMIR